MVTKEMSERRYSPADFRIIPNKGGLERASKGGY